MLEIYKSYDKISATFKITPRELENKNEATDHWTFQSTEYKLKMFYIVNISLLFYNIMTDYKQHKLIKVNCLWSEFQFLLLVLTSTQKVSGD